ncbi:hypothetical protein I3843_15G152000 [Carya illinoinensis]|nr:hypothetical protein I3843_15G152000 [Carya illinoinensis]
MVSYNNQPKQSHFLHPSVSSPSPSPAHHHKNHPYSTSAKLNGDRGEIQNQTRDETELIPDTQTKKPDLAPGFHLNNPKRKQGKTKPNPTTPCCQWLKVKERSILRKSKNDNRFKLLYWQLLYWTQLAKKAGYWFSTSDLKVADIKSNLFTHLYAGFAKVQYPIPPHQKIDDVIKFPDNSGRFEYFSETVKRRNPRVKALLSIGGEGPDISSAIASVAGDDKVCDAFIKRSIHLAREHNYDGLDLCWLYPSNAEQMDLFAKLLKAWRQEVNDEKAKHTYNYEKLLLTAAVLHHPAIPDTDGNNIDYPCQAISDYLDWINVLAIDFYTPTNTPSNTGPVHAWLNPDDINRCGKAGIEDWIEREVSTENLVLGLPFYGYEWTLVDHDDHGFFARAHPAHADRLEFRIIQTNYISTKPDHIVPETEQYIATYWYSDATTWIGFDAVKSISAKVRKARTDKNLGGYFAWHVGADDDHSTLSGAASDAWDSAISSDA